MKEVSLALLLVPGVDLQLWVAYLETWMIFEILNTAENYIVCRDVIFGDCAIAH
jgi:hypothetical protein